MVVITLDKPRKFEATFEGMMLFEDAFDTSFYEAMQSRKMRSIAQALWAFQVEDKIEFDDFIKLIKISDVPEIAQKLTEEINRGTEKKSKPKKIRARPLA